jgi:hypothetical protein
MTDMTSLIINRINENVEKSQKQYNAEQHHATVYKSLTDNYIKPVLSRLGLSIQKYKWGFELKITDNQPSIVVSFNIIPSGTSSNTASFGFMSHQQQNSIKIVWTQSSAIVYGINYGKLRSFALSQVDEIVDHLGIQLTAFSS